MRHAFATSSIVTSQSRPSSFDDRLGFHAFVTTEKRRMLALLALLALVSTSISSTFARRTYVDTEEAVNAVRRALEGRDDVSKDAANDVANALYKLGEFRANNGKSTIPLDLMTNSGYHLQMDMDVRDHAERVIRTAQDVLKSRGVEAMSIEEELSFAMKLDALLEEVRVRDGFADDDRWLPAVQVDSPNFHRRYPRGARIYFELDSAFMSSIRQVCLFFDYDVELWCGALPQHEHIYFTDCPTGAHVITVKSRRDEPSPNATSTLVDSHFYVSTPAVSLTPRRVGPHRVRLQLELFEWCHGVDGAVKLVMDGIVTDFDVIGQSPCLMTPRELSTMCLDVGNVPLGRHTLRALLVNKDGNAVAATDVVVLDADAPIETMSSSSLSCVQVSWPASAVSGCDSSRETCPAIQLPTSRPLPRAVVLPWLRSMRHDEYGVFSQNGEDGVLQSLLRLIRPSFTCEPGGTPSSSRAENYYVEFGVEDGKECNSRFLREACGWRGLMMDGGYENLDINLRRHFITAENINQLFETHAVPPNLSILSIDIDFNDLWLWKAIDQKYQPEIVIVEYNAHIPPDEARTVPYNGTRMWDGRSAYFGTGIGALDKVAREKGYSLVYCENRGVNCFFVRSDLLGGLDLSKERGLGIEDIYRPPNFYNRKWNYPFPGGKDNHSMWVWL